MKTHGSARPQTAARRFAKRVALLAAAWVACLGIAAGPATAVFAQNAEDSSVSTGASASDRMDIPDADASAQDAVAAPQQDDSDAAAVQPAAVDIQVDISVPDSYPAYTQGGVTPAPLSVRLDITNSGDDLSGASIRLPLLDCVPAGASDPYFTFDTNAHLPVEGSMVEAYDTTSVPGTLIIRLHNNPPIGSETIDLKFDFNTAYDGLVPAGAKMWSMDFGLYLYEIRRAAETHDVYCQGETAAAAYALMYSANATSLRPGATVAYELCGFNDAAYATGDWVDPRIIVRLPAQAQLSNSGAHDLVDALSITHRNAVNVRRLTSNAQYNYYEFKVNGYSIAPSSGRAFTIPLELELQGSTAPGSYPVGPAVVTSVNSSEFRQTHYTDTTLPEGESWSTYGLAEADLYAVTSTGHTPLDVSGAVTGRLKITTTIQSSGTNGQWVAPSLVTAAHGETVKMRLELKNEGDTQYGNIRLYDILPQNRDDRGSTGSLLFAGAQAAGAAIYSAPPELVIPAYSEQATPPDLQTMSLAGWQPYIGQTDAKAVFLDLGGTTIAPGETLAIELSFKVPQGTAPQTAYNQFCYSAVEYGVSQQPDTGTPFNFICPRAGFSTAEGILLRFNGNRPAGATGAVRNLPDSVYGQPIQSTVLIIGSQVPTLAGYTFRYWTETPAGTGTRYHPGDPVTFRQSGAKTLYAQWEAATVAVVYHYNYKNAPENGVFAPSNTAANQGAVGQLLAQPTNIPARTGYRFAGWHTKAANQSGANRWDFAATKVKAGGELHLYARWSAYSYKVTFNGNGATKDASPTSGRVISPATALGKLPKPPAREGYVFNGWNTKKDGSGATLTPATPVTRNLKVYAQWLGLYHELSFHLNGGSTQLPPTQAVQTGQRAVAVAAPQRPGSFFAGWNTQPDGSGTLWDFKTSYMPATDLLLYAQWVDDPETQQTDGGGIPPDTPAQGGGQAAGPQNGAGATAGQETSGTGNIQPAERVQTGQKNDRSSEEERPVTNTQPGTAPGPNGGTQDIQGAAGQSGKDGAASPEGTIRQQLRDADIPAMHIGPLDVPLYGPPTVPTWALFNLVLAVGTLLTGLAASIVLRGRYTGTAKYLGLLGTILGLAAVIIFLVTEDMRNIMALMDIWTFPMIILFAAAIVCTVLAVKRKQTTA